MSKQSGRKQAPAALTDLVDRAATTATELGDRAAETVITTLDLAANVILPPSVPAANEVRPVRRRNTTTGGAARSAVEAAAKTNRKLAHLESRAVKKTTATSKATQPRKTKDGDSAGKTRIAKRKR